MWWPTTPVLVRCCNKLHTQTAYLCSLWEIFQPAQWLFGTSELKAFKSSSVSVQVLLEVVSIFSEFKKAYACAAQGATVSNSLIRFEWKYQKSALALWCFVLVAHLTFISCFICSIQCEIARRHWNWGLRSRECLQYPYMETSAEKLSL